jgi:predicted phosphoribosyltransferase
VKALKVGHARCKVAAPMNPFFRDRHDAGRALAAKLAVAAVVTSEPVVLAVPRGGMPVAFEVAAAFRAPLDVCVVRPLEVPGLDGVVIGALASERVLVLRSAVIEAFAVSEKDVTSAVRKQARELTRRERAYRGERPPLPIVGRTVLLVDDGLADGSTLTMAIAALRARLPERLIVAVPVAVGHSYQALLGLADDVICLATPRHAVSVPAFYRDFTEVSDLDVRRLHAEARLRESNRPFVN